MLLIKPQLDFRPLKAEVLSKINFTEYFPTIQSDPR